MFMLGLFGHQKYEFSFEYVKIKCSQSIRLDQIRLDQIRLDQIRLDGVSEYVKKGQSIDQIRLDQIRLDGVSELLR